MSRKYKSRDNEQLYFECFAVVHCQPIELDKGIVLQQKLDYLHNNPVVAGFVSSPEDYVYSSTRDYVREKGPVEVILVE